MYAMECLTVTPPLRVPMVCMVGNRALDDPGAFGVEHNDALVVRDLGWMLIWVDTAQEMLDTALLAYRIAEDRRVFLPLAISADGAFLTHSQALVQVPTRAKVDRFLPAYNRGDLLLHPDNPITVAPQANEDWVIEIRRQNDEAMKRASGVIEEAYADFRKVFGRGPENPWFEEYLTDDAEIILVGMGTISLPLKVAIRNLRAQGKKVGVIRPRWFRPFPTERLVQVLSRASAVGIIDRGARRHVQLRPAAAAPVVHLRAGRPGGHARRRLQGGGHVLRCREIRQVRRQDPLAGRPGIRRPSWPKPSRMRPRSSSPSRASRRSASRSTSPPGTGPARGASPPSS
jgi:pyruvate/2-oxoacid:ferredoxin oxidoreductase alpha subunit